jgi:hypothetical protein
MNEAEFERFIAGCLAELRRKNEALDAEHGIGTYARWDDDRETELLVFSNPGDPEVLEAHVTSIGSYSLETHTWLWAWANKSLPIAAQEKAVVLKGLFERTGMRIFSDPSLDTCDEYLAWELAAAAVSQLGSLGCYREPAGHLWIFVSIDTVRSVRRAT